MCHRHMGLGFVALVSLLLTAPVCALTFSWIPGAPKVEGASLGGNVAFLAVARERRPDYSRVTVVRESAAASADLVAIPWEGGEVPLHSVWIAIDETTGALALSSPGSPEGPRPDLVTIPPGETTITRKGRWLEVLIVRAGVGRWGGTVTDGSPSDLDGLVDDTIRFNLAGLELLGGPAEATAGSPGDLVVTIDLDTLVSSASILGGAR
jgi:hypothetical protein